MSTVGPTSSGLPCWYDLMSPEPDKVLPFYAALFGWDYTPDSGPEMGHYRMAMSEGRMAAGIGQSPDADMPSVWSVYFASDSVDADAVRIEKLGGKAMVPPMDVGDAGRMGLFIDPGGAVFGLWQHGQHSGAQVRDEHGAMCWTEVNTRDGEAVAAFYGSLLAMQAHKMDGMDYRTLQRGDKAWAGVLQMNEQWEGIPPHWMAYFAVDDVDAACGVVEANGGSVRVPAFDSPYGRISVVADPCGAHFSIIQMAVPEG